MSVQRAAPDSAQPATPPLRILPAPEPGSVWRRVWHGLREWVLEKTLDSTHQQRIRQSRQFLASHRALAAQSDAVSRKRLFYALRSMDPYVFEEMVLECLHRRGYPIQRNRRYSGDGGLDGRFLWQGRWCPVQCKRYRDTIHPEHVQEFAHLVTRQRAPAGLFAHTGRTGWSSRSAASENGRLFFLSGNTLCQYIAEAST